MYRPKALEDGKAKQTGSWTDRKLSSFAARARTLPPRLAEIQQIDANYFEQNKERIRYPEFRKQGFFVGSGVVEAS